MDKLEDYIRKNREDLDLYNPSPFIWNRVQRSIRRGNNNKVKWFSIAAMVVVIFGTAVILYKYANNGAATSLERTTDGDLTIAKPQLNETEIYYNNLVNSLYLEATPMLTANPEIAKELTADFSQLDSIFLEVKKDLNDNVANQEVVEALIQNYRIKIRLLEEMLIILKEYEENPEKSKNYEL
jgi:hypothetical protein